MNGYRLSPTQRLAWSGKQDLVRARVRLARPLNRARLQAAVDTVVARHEALRLALVHHPGLRVPLQDVDDSRAVVVGAQGDLSVTLTDDALELAATPLIADPASLRLVLADLARAYTGEALPDDPEALQFLDVAEWQLEEREQAPAPAPTAPAARLVTPHADDPSAVVTATVPAAALADAARSAGVEPATVLLAAWAVALSRRAEAPDSAAEADLVLARWSDGRQAAGTAEVVGPLGGYGPLRLALPLPAAPADLLALVRAAEVAADDTFHLVDPVDEQSAAVAGFAVPPAVDPATVAGLGGLAVEVATPAPVAGPQLTALTDGDRVTLRVVGGQWLLDALLAILRTLPAALTEGVPPAVLGDAEARWLADAAGNPSEASARTLVDLLDAGLAGADQGDRAVVAADGAYSAGELRERAARVGGALAARGLSGAPVGVLATRSRDTVVAFLGVLRAGAVFVPLDPDAPAQRLAAQVRAVGAAVVVGVGGPATVTVDDLVAAGGQPPAAVPTPTDPAYVIFTSGSTGTPRPVQVSHGAAAHLAEALERTVYADSRPGLRVAVNAPLTFDASVKQLVQLGHGRSLYLVPEEVRRDGAALAAALADHGVDVLDLTPSQLRILLAGAGDARLPGLLLLGGEAIGADLWETVAALPGVHAVNLYGPTECTVDTSAAEVRAGDAPTIGRPLPGVGVWVLDERLRPVPPGVAGELCVSGPQLADGYLGDPETTARRFVSVALPSGRTERVYRTGDRVRFDADLRLRYLGRLDDQVKIHGFRVEPGEVAAVLREHPEVADAAVVARDDDGHGDRLVAYVRPGAAATVAVDVERVAGINRHETRYLYDEIFVQQVYLRDGIVLRPGATVLDVGANIGMFSLFVHTVCPDATIHAFEPVPSVADVLRRNVAEFGVPATVHSFGLSRAAGEVSFTYYPGYSMMSGHAAYADPDAEVAVIKRYLANERDAGADERDVLLDRADELLAERFAGRELTVPVRPLSAVLDELAPDRIDLLKIDVQRAEADVLAGLADRHWPLVAQVAMEVHDAAGTDTEGRLDELTRLLTERGFDVVTRQDDLLAGTDRHTLHAVRPEYAADPRPAVVVPAGPAAGPLDERLTGWLADRLPAHLVPAAVVLVDALPLTRNGKLDRAALPAPRLDRPRDSAAVAPAGRAEEILVEAWREVLGVATVGVTDSFFALGGDSIRSIQMQVAANRRGLSFRLSDIFTYQSIRELVTHGEITLDGAPPVAEAGQAAPFALVAPADRELLPAGLADAYPMTALQQGMVYHCELTGDPAMYHNVTAHRIAAPLDAAALRRALAGLVAAHPVLRTRFALGAYSEPLQLVHADVPVEVPVTDLADADPQARRARVDDLVAQERVRPFDWDRPPLLRLHAVREEADAFTLIVAECHAILDGWSLHLFLTDLLAAYDRKRAGTAGTADPGLPFREYVAAERHALADPVTRRFWLDGPGAVPPLLLGGADPRTTTTRRMPLPADPTGVVGAAARTAGVPVKSWLLAMHLRLIGELAGRDDVVSGLVVGGRPEGEGSDATLGLFLNTLPVSVQLGTRSVVELATEVWRAERELMGQHRFPLAEIVRAGAAGPRFDHFFNWTHFPNRPAGGGSRIVDSRGITVDVAFSFAVDAELDADTGRLALTVQYDHRHVATDRVDAFADGFRRLLAADPTAPLPAVATGGPAADDDARARWAARVAAAWQEVLGVAPADPATGFQAAGGDSLRALRLVTVLRQRHGSDLTLPEFVALGSYGALVDRVARDA
ncbi:methyltransferase, FkbM family/amino acid adenylation domain-containing protein [Micromonospora purpureochromogenes]|uniref:Methyltransferase, FkbM family/amino acid adenylation domain-containing protein n=1 Tax=Micromonospora purpureochromogenes TaxID=47872 RepID=A0A1C4ZPC7_9ACTN|nr:non-ribosomal peptide synthetase [Micromonospora purpureochromogenes]SCF34910.1 methyltransferase, FkbM family/amino acid adenylation domain-containing protein [Micromonospora purpureochromogenes]